MLLDQRGKLFMLDFLLTLCSSEAPFHPASHVAVQYLRRWETNPLVYRLWLCFLCSWSRDCIQAAQLTVENRTFNTIYMLPTPPANTQTINTKSTSFHTAEFFIFLAKMETTGSRYYFITHIESYRYDFPLYWSQ